MNKKDQRLLIGGLLLGAAAGYYLNSKEGRAMRSKVAETSKETYNQVKAKSNEYAEQISQKSNSLKDSLAQKASVARETLADKARMARETIANYTPNSSTGETVMDRIEDGIAKAKGHRLEANSNSIV